MNHTAMRRILPLLMSVSILLAACGREDDALIQPTGESAAAESATAITEEPATQPVSTEPEAPPMTFPAESVTEPSEIPTQESETGASAQETVPTEETVSDEVPEESYTEGENELPAVPF